jgi:hypothetical protein
MTSNGGAYGDGVIFSYIPCTIPTAAGSITGAGTVCQGQTDVAYSISSIDNATGYIWTLPTGGTITSGANTSAIIVSYSISASTGSISVNGSNACGNGTSDSLTVTVNSAPSAPTVTSPVTYCQNTSASALTATGNSLLWYTSATGGTGSSTAPTPSTANTGTTDYYVSQSNTCGESQRAMIAVTVNAIPSAPTISQHGDSLISNTVNGNQWYAVPSGALSGDTSQVFTPTEGGKYYVIVTKKGCESQPSDTIKYSEAGINTITNNTSINVYPNPANDVVIINFKGYTGRKKTIVELYNITGGLIKTQLIQSALTEVNISDLAEGVYIVKVTNDNGVAVKRVVKE